MSKQMTEPDDDGGDEVPEYRISHLQDELADTFSERGEVELIAPFRRGGLKTRVQNRATFTLSDMDRAGWTEQVLDTDGFAWTVGEPGKYIVLGRAIRDPRELRSGDRIHVNKRGGPFTVYRVLEQENGPEALQRSDSSVTVELANEDTGTDWMMVNWNNDSDPWFYVRTKDTNAKGGFRYRKVERVERSGRIGAHRLFAPPADMTEDVESGIPEILETAKDASGTGVHPSDLSRVDALFTKPIPDVFTPEDADTIREFLTDMGEWYEREANALEVETEQDKQRAAHHQDAAEQCQSLANAFNLLRMDAVDDTEDADLYYHAACGQGYTDRFKYSKHCGLCDADEQSDNNSEDGK